MENLKSWIKQWYTENKAFYKSASWATTLINALIVLLLLVV